MRSFLFQNHQANFFLKKHWLSFSLFFLFACLITKHHAIAQSTIKSIEVSKENQLEILIDKKTTFKAFNLENPNRLVLDINNSTFESGYKPLLPYFASNYRSTKDSKKIRIVFDLKQKIQLQKTSFRKIHGEKYGKIIINFLAEKPLTLPPKINSSKAETDFITAKVEEFDVETTKVQNPDGSMKYVVRKTPKIKKIPIIVLDAGHGGKDPGTIGNFARTKEKNITLSYAKELAKQLTNSGRYKVYLTRDNDYFIPLRKRVEKARRIKADLFISLHANSSLESSVSGFSIYTLSETSSDKQAELLAHKENQADIISGVDFSATSQDIMKTLIDLSQRESKNNSANFAGIVINSLKQDNIEILENSHRFAGFAVLTAPDMASVLIELGYLSNKSEEKLLNSLFYKRKISESLMRAIDEYFLKIKYE